MILKKELAKMEEDLERKQKLVAEIAAEHKNQELDGVGKAVEGEAEIGDSGKSLRALKKEVHELAMSIAEHRHMLTWSLVEEQKKKISEKKTGNISSEPNKEL